MPGFAVRLAIVALAALIVVRVPAQAQQARQHTVEITGFKFVPETLRVRAGDTLVFVNKDVVPHTATQQPSGWDSGALARDQSWSLKLEAVGALDFFCRFHPSMKGRLIVE